MVYSCFLSVDQDGTECVFPSIPERDFHPDKGKFWQPTLDTSNSWGRIELPRGTIFKLLGIELVWDDDPIEYRGQ